MKGKLTLSILSESQEGNIGDDWKYWVEVKVFNQGLQGQGIIKVKKHNLPSHKTQAPPGPPDAIEMPIGEYDDDIKVKITLEATEVDLFRNDVGKTDVDLHLDYAEPSDEPVVLEREISVGVAEAARAAVLALKLRLVLTSE